MASKNIDQKLYTSLTNLSLKNKHEKPTNILHLIDTETQKSLDSLIQQRDELKLRITWLNEISKNIEEVSSHPRVASRAKMSKFVEVDCLLNTSEYRLKYAEFSVISSLKMTSEYCQKSIADMHVLIETYNEQIEKVNEQQLLAQGLAGGKPVEVHKSENSIVTVYENGLVDIMETELQPYERPVRKPRFKTCEERDKFVQEAVTKQANIEEVLNCTYEVSMNRKSPYSGGDSSPNKLSEKCTPLSPEEEEFVMRSALYQKTIEHEKDLQLHFDVLREILPLMNNDAVAFGVALDNYHITECSNEYNGIPFFQFIESPDDSQEFVDRKDEFSQHFNETQKAIYFLIQDAETLIEKIGKLCYEIDHFSQSRDQLQYLREYHFNNFLECHQNESSPAKINESAVKQNECIQTMPCSDRNSTTEIVYAGEMMAPVTKCVWTMKYNIQETSSIQVVQPTGSTRREHYQNVKNTLTEFINTL